MRQESVHSVSLWVNMCPVPVSCVIGQWVAPIRFVVLEHSWKKATPSEQYKHPDTQDSKFHSQASVIIVANGTSWANSHIHTISNDSHQILSLCPVSSLLRQAATGAQGLEHEACFYPYGSFWDFFTVGGWKATGLSIG